MTYQEVYLMDNLTIEAKAIYGMLCSYAGSGDTAYPSVEFMCSKLHITKTRFYKHMNLLIGAGVVERKAIRNEAGLFSSNIYRLVPNSQNIQNPYTEKWYADNLCSDNLHTENQATNNNSFNNNSLNNNNKNIICPETKKKTPDRKLKEGGTRRAAARAVKAQKPQTRFNNFDQRSYDYEKLEGQLLNSQQIK